MDGLRETNTVPIFSHVPSSRLDKYLFSTKVYDNRAGLVKQLAKSLYFINLYFELVTGLVTGSQSKTGNQLRLASIRRSHLAWGC